jgi:hypothetical protein
LNRGADQPSASDRLNSHQHPHHGITNGDAKGHARSARSHSRRGRRVGGGKPAPAIDRFLAKTRPGSAGCVLWDGCINSKGYGCFCPGGAVSPVLAHRWIWEHQNGLIPDALTVDHLCANKACVNVAHMELVTVEENSSRAAERRRLARVAANFADQPASHELKTGAVAALPDVSGAGGGR